MNFRYDSATPKQWALLTPVAVILLLLVGVFTDWSASALLAGYAGVVLAWVANR